MKNMLKKLLTVFMAVIFLLLSTSAMADWSDEKLKGDYRNMNIFTRKNIRVEKPIAQFAVNRISNNQIVDKVISYDGYDCSRPFQKIECQIGDRVTFEDLSRDKNPGGKIIEWDWQYYGEMGNFNRIYKYNILETENFECTTPGKTTFYLAVKNNIRVKAGCCDPWSENGDHQIKGITSWFPEGAYWYFTAVTVQTVKPTQVHIRYWDVVNNTIIKENTVDSGKIYTPNEIIKKNIQLENPDGYIVSKWNVVLPDNTLQYSGSGNSVDIEMTENLDEKYLNVECYPNTNTGVEVRYWDKHANVILQSEYLPGEIVTANQEKIINVDLSAPRGYKIETWYVQLPDGTIQYYGGGLTADIALNSFVPKKYLNVECYKTDNLVSGVDTGVDIKYYNSQNNDLISEMGIVGGTVYDGRDINVNVNLENPKGYIIDSWELILGDGTIQQTGTEKNFDVILSSLQNHKIVKVKCTPIGNETENGEITLPDSVIDIRPDGECIGEIEWTETDSHKVQVGSYSNGRKKYRICTHTFKYKAVLEADALIEPDKFKSGYGFEVKVRCSLTSNLVSNTGGCSSWGRNRRALSEVKNPTKATVYIPWNMTNKLGDQTTAITMEETGSLNFVLPKSNVSHTGERKIYTPVELAGTEENPVSHPFEIYINGGGVGEIEFCKKINRNITIDGVMYDDDFSGAD